MAATPVCRFAIAVVLLLAALPMGAASGQERKPGPIGQPSGPYREQEFFYEWTDRAGKTWLLHAKLYRPPGETPRPLAVIAHGATGDENLRAGYSPARYDTQARWFAGQGFVVVTPMRRGYGKSDGPPLRYCTARRSTAFAANNIANEIQGAVEHMTHKPYVDARRIVVAGHSGGGLGALALAARNPAGVVAAINFAGGIRGTKPGGARSGPQVCELDELIGVAGELGGRARIPSLWVYADNDMWFDAKVSRQMFEAYRSGGALVDYQLLGSFGRDGHGLFTETSGISYWGPVVQEFIRKHKLLN